MQKSNDTAVRKARKFLKESYDDCYNVALEDVNKTTEGWLVVLSFTDTKEAGDKPKYHLMPGEIEFRQLVVDEENLEVIKMDSFANNI